MEKLITKIKFSGFIKSEINAKLIELESITEDNVDILKNFFKSLYKHAYAGINCKLYEVKPSVFITSYSAYAENVCKTVSNGKDPDKILFEGNLSSIETIAIDDFSDEEIGVIISFFKEINNTKGYRARYEFNVTKRYEYIPSEPVDNQED